MTIYSAQQHHINDALEIVRGVLIGSNDNSNWDVDYSRIDHHQPLNVRLLLEIRTALERVESPDELTVNSFGSTYELTDLFVRGSEVEIQVTPELLKRAKIYDDPMSFCCGCGIHPENCDCSSGESNLTHYM